MSTIRLKNWYNSTEEIEQAVKSSLDSETVVADKAAAEEWFRKNGYNADDMVERTVLSQTANVFDKENNTSIEHRVNIREYYVDPGSVDYVYAYEIY